MADHMWVKFRDGGETLRLVKSPHAATLTCRWENYGQKKVWLGYFPDLSSGDVWINGEDKEEVRAALEATLRLKGIIE